MDLSICLFRKLNSRDSVNYLKDIKLLVCVNLIGVQPDIEDLGKEFFQPSVHEISSSHEMF